VRVAPPCGDQVILTVPSQEELWHISPSYQFEDLKCLCPEVSFQNGGAEHDKGSPPA